MFFNIFVTCTCLYVVVFDAILCHVVYDFNGMYMLLLLSDCEFCVYNDIYYNPKISFFMMNLVANSIVMRFKKYPIFVVYFNLVVVTCDL
jgi:hypothetical protein